MVYAPIIGPYRNIRFTKKRYRVLSAYQMPTGRDTLVLNKNYCISGGWYEDIGVVEGEGTTRCGGAPGTGSDCVDAI